MIKKVIADFKGSVVFQKNDEVDLFRALASSITKHSTSVFIDETHGGNVCNVTFTSVTGKPETCEIADLLMVSCSPSSGDLRATFWQAKKQGVSKWLNVTHAGSQLDFKGQFNQWDLLSRRPSISGVACFNPPCDLLSSFSSASIGSFGIFFEKGGNIEVAHSIAEFISCPTPAAKHPTLSINGYLTKYSYMINETIVKRDLHSFLEALFEGQIGARIDPTLLAHRWLMQKVHSKIQAKNPPKSINSLFDNFLESDSGNVATGSIDGLSILFVGELNANQAPHR